MTDLRRTDRDLMRAMNTKLVLDVVRGVDMTSQADLIKATRLSTGTIVSIVRELRKLGMLADLGPGASRGGRKPTLLKLNSAAAVVLACRVGSNSATVGVLDLNGNILSRRDLVLAPGCGPEPFMAALVACLPARAATTWDAACTDRWTPRAGSFSSPNTWVGGTCRSGMNWAAPLACRSSPMPRRARSRWRSSAGGRRAARRTSC